MNFEGLIDRGLKVMCKISDMGVDGLEKYDKISLMFFNSTCDILTRSIIVPKEELFEYYQVIHRLCAIPGMGSMAYPSCWSREKKISSNNYWFYNDYYELEKKLKDRDIYLYNIKKCEEREGCYFLRYARLKK